MSGRLRILTSLALVAGFAVVPACLRHSDFCVHVTRGGVSGCLPPAYRPFSGRSFWNRPLPRNAPVSPDSDRILSFIESGSSTNYIHLSGASSRGRWGNPIYWASPSDPTYRIRDACRRPEPREFRSVRIPIGARPDPTSDASMTVYDLGKGFVYGLFHASFNPDTNTWSSCGGSVYDLRSNGLSGGLHASSDRRNSGHRGIPPSVFAVRYDEVNAGIIRHVLKISVPVTRCRHVFPMIDDECGTGARYAPPEGTRIRIKPSVDVSALDLSPAALTVARALQQYGAVISDQSGGPVSLKLENTVAEGRGWLWRGVLEDRSLRRIPLRLFEVLRFGYAG